MQEGVTESERSARSLIATEVLKLQALTVCGEGGAPCE